MKTQTAIQWLVNEIQTKYDKSFVDFYGAEIEQAKEMEKQQITNAFIAGDKTDCFIEENIHEFATDYFNETFTQK